MRIKDRDKQKVVRTSTGPRKARAEQVEPEVPGKEEDYKFCA